MNPDFVYFDLDNTLLDHSHAERKALNDVRSQFADGLGHYDLDQIHQTYHEHSAELWRQYADGAISKDTLQHERFARTLSTLEISTLDPDDVGTYYMQRYAEHWRYLPGARDAFEHVADRYRVGILTNGFAEVQRAKLNRFPELRNASETVVITEEIGHLKPHPEAFAHAEQAAGASGEDILYVGDSRRSDVQGGHEAGWHVAWYAPTANGVSLPPGCVQIEAWDALVDLLR